MHDNKGSATETNKLLNESNSERISLSFHNDSQMFPSMDDMHLVCCFSGFVFHLPNTHSSPYGIMLQSRNYLVISVFRNPLLVIRDVWGDIFKSYHIRIMLQSMY